MTVGESLVKDLINTSHNFMVPHTIQTALANFTVPDVFPLFGDELYDEVKVMIDNIISESSANDAMTRAIQRFADVSYL